MMKILVVGAGVIGTVYGAHLATAEHAVSVLAHGSRTDEVERLGLAALDVADGLTISAPVRVVEDIGRDAYDLILLTVRRDQIRAASQLLAGAIGHPSRLVFGNNPDGRAALPRDLPGLLWQGFPGVGGVLVGGVARYVRITEQPTAIETGDDPALAELAASLRTRGFAVTRIADMNGWLAYHATFVACVAAALGRCGIDPRALAADRPTLVLMCRAITEGFALLKASGRHGLPSNLAILHHPWLRPVAVTYWARAMRSPMGELCFAGHTRHAQAEMHALAADVLADTPIEAKASHLRRLLNPSSTPEVADSREA
jgi:2-dehydropantoate 2-reductase